MDFLSGQTPCLNFLISEELKTERQLTCQESRWDSSALLQWVNDATPFVFQLTAITLVKLYLEGNLVSIIQMLL
jgi:hypothetical protein